MDPLSTLPESHMPFDMDPALPLQEPDMVLSPRAAAVGDPVQVSMGDLPPGTVILVGFGGIGTPHEILTETRVDGQGRFSVSVEIPEWAELNQNHFFYMAFSDQRPRVFSDPFVVTGADGSIRVAGEITAEAGACVVLRGSNDALFSLVGNVGTPAPGSRVVVEGKVVEGSACGEGVTIQVTAMRPG
jgi:hypothetical protein